MKEMIKEIIREEMGKMYKKFYFMSGLPRSGSTLLSSILNQNPRFHSGPSSPVVPTMLAIENSLSNDELFRAYPKPEMGKEIISSVLSNYYLDVQKPIVFDKNRSWVNRIHYIRGYFNIAEPKILCPVRDISEILTSFLTMIRNKPISSSGKMNFIDEMLIKNNMLLTDENRCGLLFSDDGILGQSYNGIKQVIVNDNQKCLHFIEYNDLINRPEETMKKIYDFLEEEYFEHNFKNFENIHQENDADVYGIDDMHRVRNKLESISKDPQDILPKSILDQCKDLEFWRSLENFEFEQPEKNATDSDQIKTLEQINDLDDNNTNIIQ